MLTSSPLPGELMTGHLPSLAFGVTQRQKCPAGRQSRLSSSSSTRESHSRPADSQRPAQEQRRAGSAANCGGRAGRPGTGRGHRSRGAPRCASSQASQVVFSLDDVGAVALLASYLDLAQVGPCCVDPAFSLGLSGLVHKKFVLLGEVFGDESGRQNSRCQGSASGGTGVPEFAPGTVHFLTLGKVLEAHDDGAWFARLRPADSMTDVDIIGLNGDTCTLQP